MKLTFEHYNHHNIATSLHDTGSQAIVIMAHGFIGNNIGPNNLFVILSRGLEKLGTSSLRFDQACNGNSDGDFYDNSFNDWVATIVDIVRQYQASGREVILLGWSMGGAASIVAAAQLPDLKALVTWVPDPKAGRFDEPADGSSEEGGTLISNQFWHEAHAAQIADRLAQVSCPTLILSASDDKFMNAASWRALKTHVQPHHRFEIMQGYPHGGWNYQQKAHILDQTLQFIKEYNV
jgi:pimeloyl-ACP methyl ester carboxylesterase